MHKAVRDYLALANAVAEAPRRAVTAAKILAAQGGAAVGQVSQLTEEVLETSRANREALVNLVRFEVDRALGRLGLATGDEVAALALRLATLEAELRNATATADADAAGQAPVGGRPAAKKAAKKAVKKPPAAKKAANGSGKAATKKAAKKATRVPKGQTRPPAADAGGGRV